MNLPTIIGVITIIPLAYAFFRFVSWFLEPYFAARRDTNILPNFTLIDANSKNINPKRLFPTSFDPPTLYLSLVFPAYNEEKRIKPCLDATLSYLNERQSSDPNFTYEIIVVSDGSKDKTDEVVESYMKKFNTSQIRLLTYPVNQGKGYAVRQGLLHARGEYILFADADGASEISCIERLEKNLPSDCDGTRDSIIMIGSRAHMQEKAEAQRTFFRNIAMWGWHFVCETIGGVTTIRDTQCGFKMFSRRAVQLIVPSVRIRRWAFDVEMLYLSKFLDTTLVEVPIQWEEIPDSKLSVIKATFTMFREVSLMRFCYVTGLWYIHKDFQPK